VKSNNRNYRKSFLDTENTTLFLHIAILFSLTILIRLFFLFPNSFAVGFDGYYYALQVRSLKETGQLLIADNSLVFQILRFFAMFTQDVVFSNKIAALLFGSFNTALLYLLSIKLRINKWIAFLCGILFLSSYTQNFLGFELQKNNISMTFFLTFLFFFYTSFSNKKYIICTFLFFILTLLTHKLMGALAVLFLIIYFIIILIYNETLRKKIIANKKLLLLICSSFLMIIIITFFLSPLRIVDLKNFLSSFALYSGLVNRLKKIIFVRNIGTMIELIFLHIIPFLFIPFFKTYIKNSKNPKQQKYFLSTLFAFSLILIFPFLKFDWDSIAFRFLIINTVPCCVFIGYMVSISKKKLKTTLQILFLITSILLMSQIPTKIKTFHTRRYPDYKDLYSSMLKIKDYVPLDKKIIAHKGLSSFIWYITGIEGTHFTPLENLDEYYRIVYGFGVIHFEPYLETGNYEKPVEIKMPYFLVEERLWQKFYNDKKDKIDFLKEWVNPSQVRPAHVYH